MATKVNQEEEWKRIQIQTFTRWCNARLAVQKLTVEDLSMDLSDGVRLVILLEVLSQKRLGKFNKKPRVYAQRMENVEVALQFITQKEKIRLVNIGSGDIVGGNLKLILGLIWTLILHYQISLGLSSTPSTSNGSESTQNTEEQSGMLKDKLLSFLKQMIQLPGKKIRNVTTDWNDGILIGTLVDSTARGLCPECDEMVPENALQNATVAMALAENWLGVPQVLHPEDMVNPNIDELSMMTYLSQFLTAKLKPGAPLKPVGNPSYVKVSGPGIQSQGVNVTMPSVSFTVDTEGAGPGKVNVLCTGPIGPVKVNMVASGRHTFSCSYLPSVKGTYTMEVYFSRQPISGSPFKIQVAPHDASKVVASGPGLIRGRVGKPVTMVFDVTEAGEGSLSLEIEGSVKISPTSILKKPGLYHVDFKTPTVGKYVLNAKYGGDSVPGSPFTISVTNPTEVTVSGTGVTGNEVSVGKKAELVIDTSEAGIAPLTAMVTTPTGKDFAVELVPQKTPGQFHGEYTPQEPGNHKLQVMFDGECIPKSPFVVTIPNKEECSVLEEPNLESTPRLGFTDLPQQSPFNLSVPDVSIPLEEACSVIEEQDLQSAPLGNTTAPQLPTTNVIVVSGDGIEGGVLKGKAELTVKIPGGIDEKLVSVEIDGPCNCDVRRSCDGAGTLHVKYVPQMIGTYNVDIKYNGEHIRGSPFHPSWIRPAPDASKCSVIGVQECGRFTVDCRDGGGNGCLGVAIFGAYVPAENVAVTHNGDYTFDVTYRIPHPGKTTISVKWHDVHLKGSPFIITTI